MNGWDGMRDGMNKEEEDGRGSWKGCEMDYGYD